MDEKKVEIVNPVSETIVEQPVVKKNPKRIGIRNTKVTSMSISNEFRQFMDDYNISPTDAVRKGVAIILFERGLPQYKSELNAQRFKLLQGIVKESQMQDFPEKIRQAEILLREIRTVLEL